MKLTVGGQFGKGLVGRVDKALGKIDGLETSIEPLNETYARFTHVVKALSELRTSIVNNRHVIPNDGERYHNGEASATGFVESTVHEVVSKRFCKKQQMQWLPNTVPPLRQAPGEFMVKTGEEALPDSVRRRTPQVVETGAAQTLAVGYGLTFGSLYTLLRPQGGLPMRGWRHPGDCQLGYWVFGLATGFRAHASCLAAESTTGHCPHC